MRKVYKEILKSGRELSITYDPNNIKSHCVICGQYLIGDREKRYLQRGNFCFETDRFHQAFCRMTEELEVIRYRLGEHPDFEHLKFTAFDSFYKELRRHEENRIIYKMAMRRKGDIPTLWIDKDDEDRLKKSKTLRLMLKVIKK